MVCFFVILSINGEGLKCFVGKVGEKFKEEVIVKFVDEIVGE